MPRINDTDYRTRRDALQAHWEKGSLLLGRLTAEQQDALRAFYFFDAEAFAAASVEATKGDASLAARAGLAYRAFAKL